MELEEMSKTFLLGSTVRVVDSSPSSRFGPLQTYGMRGCVRKLDAKAGVCVSLFISRIFQPCFWYLPYALAVDNELKPFMPASAGMLEVAMTGGRGAVLIESAITTGVLRSWLIDKAQAKPNQILYQFIAKMDFRDLLYVYQENGTTRLVQWLKENDTRVKRPVMTDTEDRVFDSFIVKRPKMG